MKIVSRFLGFLVLCALIAPGLVGAVETPHPDADGLTSWIYTPTEKPDPTKTYWLVVGVHGVGGGGKGACGVAGWATEFDNVIVLGPSFVQPKRENLPPRDPNAPRPTTMPAEIYQMAGPAHVEKLQALIAELGKTWKLQPKVFLHGFSAGAQFVHRYAFKFPAQVAAVSAHSAGSWARPTGADAINPAARAIPFAVSCGEADHGSGGPPGTPTRIEGVRLFAAQLKDAGFTVELKTWPGVAHDQCPDAKAMAKALLERTRAAAH